MKRTIDLTRAATQGNPKVTGYAVKLGKCTHCRHRLEAHDGLGCTFDKCHCMAYIDRSPEAAASARIRILRAAKMLGQKR